MARIRTIKPEFWTDAQVMSASRDARLLFIGMWNFADDGGNLPANIKMLKAQVFPCDNLYEEQIGELVDELVDAGLLAAYEADSRLYWNVTGWATLQRRIDQPTYRHPGPDGTVIESQRRRKDSVNTRQAFAEQTPNEQRNEPVIEKPAVVAPSKPQDKIASLFFSKVPAGL